MILICGPGKGQGPPDISISLAEIKSSLQMDVILMFLGYGIADQVTIVTRCIQV